VESCCRRRARALSQNPDLGESKGEVPVEYEGEALKIGYNAGCIIEVPAVFGSVRWSWRWPTTSLAGFRL